MNSDKCQLSYLGGADIAKGQEWLGDANASATGLYDRWNAQPEDSLTRFNPRPTSRSGALRHSFRFIPARAGNATVSDL
jgi:hypothetical protein